MYLWKIIIRYAGKRKVLKIRGKEGQANLEVYEKAKAYAKKLREEDDTGLMSIELVSGTKAYGPKKGTVIPRNHLWCPFCVKPRIFLEDSRLGVRKCIVCGVSDSEYHVKHYNGIFKKEMEEYLLSIKLPKKGKEG